MVTDTQGKSIVIEFIEGEMKIFENPLGIITNAPTFDWHMTNLRNYVNLSAVTIPNKKIEDLDFAALGAGSGMIGLPGDFTPPSRFVRATPNHQAKRSMNYSEFWIILMSVSVLRKGQMHPTAISTSCEVLRCGQQHGT